ncbi:MAG: hypothetical protein KC486_08975 [Myxococcales bacterium]|nr:hypothetical protein [Myxococcales bacterium]
MAATTILSNMYGEVTRQGDGSLRLVCQGKVITALLAGGALLFTAGGVAGAALGLAPVAFIGPVVMIAALGGLALGRRRRHGVFTVDPAAGSFVRARSRDGAPVEEVKLSEVGGLRSVRDLTDGMNLGPAYWLVVDVGGRPYRVAKGKRDELAPVIAALRAAGIGEASG